MSVKRVINLPNVSGWSIASGVASAAHTVTCQVPVGPRYHIIWLQANAGTGKVMNDLLGEIRIKLNGKVQRVATADEINKINILNGGSLCAAVGAQTAAALFYLPIFFCEPWRKSLESQDGLAWGTGDVSTFVIEIDLKPSTFTSPVPITLKAEVDNSLVMIDGHERAQPLGAIAKWGNVQYPISAASSWHDFAGLPKRDFYQAIHLVDLNIDEWEVKIDNNVIRQDTLAGNQARLLARDMLPAPAAAGDVPLRSMVDIVFDHDDLLSSALPMSFNGRQVQDFNLRIKAGASGTVPRVIKTIYELIGPAE